MPLRDMETADAVLDPSFHRRIQDAKETYHQWCFEDATFSDNIHAYLNVVDGYATSFPQYMPPDPDPLEQQHLEEGSTERSYLCFVLLKTLDVWGVILEANAAFTLPSLDKVLTNVAQTVERLSGPQPTSPRMIDIVGSALDGWITTQVESIQRNGISPPAQQPDWVDRQLYSYTLASVLPVIGQLTLTTE